jgi:hypothetical protein
LCVFCGSSRGSDPRFGRVAADLGRAIAEDGHDLVYGGGAVGLMGVVADAALAAGGSVVGVITDALVDAEVAHRGLTDLTVVGSMHERKAAMAELADGVVVLPGGFGTLDETFELLTWNQLGLVAIPVVLLDVDGFFDGLFEFADRAVSDGFLRPAHRDLMVRVTDVDAAIRAATGPAAAPLPKWVR